MKKILFILTLPIHLFAQLTIGTDSTAVAYAQKVVGSGVTITNATLSCGVGGTRNFSYVGSTMSVVGGVLLTTGLASDASMPAQIVSQSTGNNFHDTDLISIEPGAIYDNCILTFDFIPLYNQLNITYVFGSSEYDGYQCSQYNDAFGIFLTGPNPLGGNYNSTNIATLPNGVPVSINNVNDGSNQCTSAHNPTYYVNNYTGTDIVYEGLTTAITSVKPVMPDSIYHMKVAIADAGDEVYDSGVFIQDSSFTFKNVSNVTLLTLGFPDTLCTDTNSYPLTGGLPSGGRYSGPGVSGNIFNPTGMAAGTYTISYTNIDSLGYIGTAKHTVTLNTCTSGINMLYNKNGTLLIYPNPSNGLFSIETNVAEKQNLQIFDVNGKLVLSQNIINKVNIDASNLSEGVYSINLTGYSGIINKKLVILK